MTSDNVRVHFKSLPAALFWLHSRYDDDKVNVKRKKDAIVDSSRDFSRASRSVTRVGDDRIGERLASSFLDE